jgi:hypothetical protein
MTSPLYPAIVRQLLDSLVQHVQRAVDNVCVFYRDRDRREIEKESDNVCVFYRDRDRREIEKESEREGQDDTIGLYHPYIN